MKAGASFSDNKCALNIYIPMAPTGKNESCALYFSDHKQIELQRSQAYQIQLDEAGKFTWLNSTLYSLKYPFTEKRLTKCFSSKPGLNTIYINNVEAELGKQFYYVCHSEDYYNGGGPCTSVAKEEWEKVVQSEQKDPENQIVLVPPK